MNIEYATAEKGRERPRNRRRLIITSAAELLYRRGYRNVTMGDIAQSVSIGPSALYRHFSGKQELLGAVVTEAVDTFRGALRSTEAANLSSALQMLVPTAIEHNQFGVLWQREGRYLGEPERAQCHESIRDTANDLTALLQRQRPELGSAGADLLAWAAVAVLSSVSFHAAGLSVDEHRSLVLGLTERVASTELPDILANNSVVQQHSSLALQSRRELLLATAITMFAEQGYHEVGIETIGAAAGLSGPGIYQYFPTKLDLLIAALTRVGEWLQLDLQRILMTNDNPERALNALLHSYVGFTLGHPHHIDLLIAEVVNLPIEHGRRFAAIRREYIAEWTHLLRAIHPELGRDEAQVRIRAAMTVADDFARTPHLRALPWIQSATHEIGRGILDLTESTG